MTERRAIGLIVLSLALSGCETTPLPELGPQDVPAAWQGPMPDDVAPWPESDWWRTFEAEELSALVDEVLRSNLELATIERNLQAARLTLRDADLARWPTPVLSAGVATSYVGQRPDGGDFDSSRSESASVDLGLVYADVLGIPGRWEGARMQYRAVEARAAGLRLNVLGTTATAYFQVLLLRDRIAVAEISLANAEAVADIAEARYQAGTATEIDVLQQRIAVERQRNALRDAHQSEFAARAALAQLLAKRVPAVEVAGQSLDPIAVPRVAPGLPSALLQRRPDLVAAEADLRAARVDVDLARLAFLPDITLTASGSLVSDSLRGLVDAPDLAITASAALAQTLIDNGARGRTTARARLALENALAAYRSLVIAAYNEIEVSLENIVLLEDRSRTADVELERAERAFRIAQVRYREGVADYQTVLQAQDSLNTARLGRLDVKQARLGAVVAFYQALGGGWQAASEDNGERDDRPR